MHPTLFRPAIAVLFIFISMEQLLAGSNLNPPYGDPAYQAFSVFTPDRDDGIALRRDVIVVFHGFRSAVPNGTFKRVRKLFYGSHTVIGVNYDYMAPQETLARLEELRGSLLAGRRLVTLGTSLGAFWARVFGHRAGAEKIVMINPVAVPNDWLRRYVGTKQFSERRQIEFAVAPEHAKAYRAVEASPSPAIEELLILTRQDERLDYRIALEHFADAPATKIVVYPEGKHTIDIRTHAAREEIRHFVMGTQE